MDYKKAYENALERAKDIWAIHKDERPILEYIFYPENFFQTTLKEKLKELSVPFKVGVKIISKTNPNVILQIISNDCHGDKFECSNGSVLSLDQLNKHYDLYIEENKGSIIIN